MCKFLLTTLVLFGLITSAAYAENINGGWSLDNGDLLILLQSKKDAVVGIDVGQDKQVRHLFLGSINGNALAMQTQDGDASLAATITDGNLNGTLTETDAENAVNGTLNFAYKGGAYDGLWQIDGGNAYLAYATLLLKGAKMVMAPYFTVGADQSVSYDLFMGQTVTNRFTGEVSYQGISILDLSTALELKFSSTSAADGAFTKNGAETGFTTVKIKSVAKQ